jgi:hypothetical protein
LVLGVDEGRCVVEVCCEFVVLRGIDVSIGY